MSLKGYFAGFHCWEYASGVVATPKSPIPAARASGVISKKGTPVVITLSLFCPMSQFVDIKTKNSPQ
jgi:hypothetical protein